MVVGASSVPGDRWQRLVAGAARRLFLREFLARFDRSTIARRLPAVAAWRLENAILLDAEREAIRRLVAGPGSSGPGVSASASYPNG